MEECRRRNREYQRSLREKISQEPELKEEFLRQERQRLRQRVREGKIKQIKDLTEREQRSSIEEEVLEASPKET